MFWHRKINKQLEEQLSVTVEGVINRVLTSVQEQVKQLYRAVDATQEVDRLTKQISTLKIEKSTIEEGFAREKREIEHKLGLEKLRQDQDLKLGLREQKVKLEEEHLAKNKELFTKEMEFIKDRMTKENDQLRGLMTEILDRLPTQHTEIKRTEKIGG